MNKRIESLVDQAVVTAGVFSNGHPADLQVFFDVTALGKLMAEVNTPEKMLMALDAVDVRIRVAISEDRNITHAQAGVILRERIERSPGRRYREGPDGLDPVA